MKKIVILLFVCGVFMNPDCSGKKLGNWVNLDPKSENAVKAYNFMKKELKKKYPDVTVLDIIKARSQVVSGYKVSLFCNYKYKSGEKSKLLAEIYVDVKGRYKLKKYRLFGEDDKHP